ncbi:MAG: hypothetical protein AABY58_03975 [Nitrospirota bacterium]
MKTNRLLRKTALITQIKTADYTDKGKFLIGVIVFRNLCNRNFKRRI